MNKGLIFDIRRFSVHDGPGIRTTVFFKGCPLSCWWCHNPEGRFPEPEETERTLTLDGKKYRVEETTGTYLSATEVLDEVLRDRIFYEESGGGVTLSGGEPLLQPDFAAEVLRALKDEGVHTAVDTCGQVRREDLEKVLDFTDLFLFDIKLLDEADHLEYTGVSNKLIHDNLFLLIERKKQVIIRFPVIPGITDTGRNIDLLKIMLMQVKPAVSQIHILPYHSMATKKYLRLNIDNKLENVKNLNKKDLEHLQDNLGGLGFKVIIGG